MEPTMSVIRVNVDRDDATVVKQIKNDSELVKATKLWEKSRSDLAEHLRTCEGVSKQVIAASRQVYTICDKRMEEKDVEKSQLAAPTSLRKAAYDFTNELKKRGLG
jgi:hypothetical protein